MIIHEIEISCEKRSRRLSQRLFYFINVICLRPNTIRHSNINISIVFIVLSWQACTFVTWRLTNLLTYLLTLLTDNLLCDLSFKIWSHLRYDYKSRSWVVDTLTSLVRGIKKNWHVNFLWWLSRSSYRSRIADVTMSSRWRDAWRFWRCCNCQLLKPHASNNELLASTVFLSLILTASRLWRRVSHSRQITVLPLRRNYGASLASCRGNECCTDAEDVLRR